MNRSRRQALYVTPGNETRAERKARLGEIEAQTRSQRQNRDKLQPVELPAAPVGKHGNGLAERGYWNPVQMRVATHQATSHNLSGIYPFVADSGIGHRGPVVGIDLNADALWHFSPWDAYNDPTERGTFSTNILVLGAYRAGKSGTVKCLATRSIAFGHKVVVPSDSKGEWVAVAEAIPGGVVIKLGGRSNNRLNPLDAGPRRSSSTDDEHNQMVMQRRITTLVTLTEKALAGKSLEPAEHEALYTALHRAIDATNDSPTIREVQKQLRTIERGDTDAEPAVRAGATQPRLVLNRYVTGDLSGLFEDESTVEFDADAPIVVVDTSELFQRSDLVAQVAQVCTTAWIQAVISDRDRHDTRYLIREEGWRDMSTVESLLMYQQWLKLSRHYGISNVVILHKMGDLDAVGEEGSQERNLAYSVVGDIENKFIFRVNQQEEANLRTRLNLPAPHVAQALALPKGVFLAYVGSFVYVVDCFATSTAFELELFSTDAAMQGASEFDSSDMLASYDLDAMWPSSPDPSASGWLNALTTGGIE